MSEDVAWVELLVVTHTCQMMVWLSLAIQVAAVVSDSCTCNGCRSPLINPCCVLYNKFFLRGKDPSDASKCASLKPASKLTHAHSPEAIDTTTQMGLRVRRGERVQPKVTRLVIFTSTMMVETAGVVCVPIAPSLPFTQCTTGTNDQA